MNDTLPIEIAVGWKRNFLVTGLTLVTPPAETLSCFLVLFEKNTLGYGITWKCRHGIIEVVDVSPRQVHGVVESGAFERNTQLRTDYD